MIQKYFATPLTLSLADLNFFLDFFSTRVGLICAWGYVHNLPGKVLLKYFENASYFLTLEDIFSWHRLKSHIDKTIQDVNKATISSEETWLPLWHVARVARSRPISLISNIGSWSSPLTSHCGGGQDLGDFRKCSEHCQATGIWTLLITIKS